MRSVIYWGASFNFNYEEKPASSRVNAKAGLRGLPTLDAKKRLFL